MLTLLFLFFLGLTHSRYVYYPKWSTTPITEAGVTKYVGKISIPRPNGQTVTVTVKFSSTKPISFIQDGTGVDYWKSGSANSPYTNSLIDNDPPASSVIGLRYAATNTFEFDHDLGDVFLAFMSINGNTYTFDRDFSILSIGDGAPRACGYWGCGTVSYSSPAAGVYALTTTAGEPHGTIGFKGVFNKLTWTSKIDENWNGVTIGTYGLEHDVYECVDMTESLNELLSKKLETVPKLVTEDPTDKFVMRGGRTGDSGFSVAVIMFVSIGAAMLTFGAAVGGYVMVQKMRR